MSDYPISQLLISIIILLFTILILLVMLASAIRIVPEYKRLSVFRLGKYIGEKGPGIVILLPIIDKDISIDLRKQFTNINKQHELWGAIGETLTTVQADGSVYISEETWSALSKNTIPEGKKVRVVKVILEVEQI
jgi:regulator of protease activity HflC (stomatin/prohibitin superfamily)